MAKRIDRDRRRPSKRPHASAGAKEPSGELTPSEAGALRTPLAGRADVSQLARAVPHLAPEMLHQLIRHRGLDDCGEIVAAATPTQLAAVFDLDLWRSAQPGRDERFDVERFGEWLELLADAGETVAARTVAAMDEQLVIAGLSKYIRVFDPAAMTTTVDGQPLDIDVMPHRGPECEVGGYLVRGVRTDAWDAIVALLTALDADHHARFHALMRKCRGVSNSTPEVDGLDDLLLEPEQLLHDVSGDRERRRSGQGYSTPADARAFLLMARQRRRPTDGRPPVNPLVAAYFRRVTEAIESANESIPNLPPRALEPPATPSEVADALDAVVDMLAVEGGSAPRPRALLEGPEAGAPRFARLRMLMELARDSDETVYVVRSHELAFLANTLLAGCSVQSRSFTPQEASDAAAGVCNLGLEQWSVLRPSADAKSMADRGVAMPDTFLLDHDLVSVFEVGWAVLHENVSMFAVEQLLLVLSQLRCRDLDIQKGLKALRRELTTQREAGMPWRARNALDVLAMLDMPAWVAVLGLLDECPVIPAALTAILEGRTGPIKTTEFEFISTSSQLGTVRDFMARFLDILSR